MATDFGDCSARAVEVAVGLARLCDAALIVIHAVEPFIPPYHHAHSRLMLAPEPSTFEPTVQRQLDGEIERIRATFPAAQSRLLHGSPAEGITTFASENDVDLIVVGTHGRQGPSRWLLGSVAEKVVRSSRVPVLSVRGDAQDLAAWAR